VGDIDETGLDGHLGTRSRFRLGIRCRRWRLGAPLVSGRRGHDEFDGFDGEREEGTCGSHGQDGAQQSSAGGVADVMRADGEIRGRGMGKKKGGEGHMVYMDETECVPEPANSSAPVDTK
jgi:hypothetical protein